MTFARSIARVAGQQHPLRPQHRVFGFQFSASRVYVASPIQTFATPRYDASVIRIQSHFPEAEMLPAREVFVTNAEWRKCWPALLPTLDAVVFFDDEDGCIGAGTEQEIGDAWIQGTPVFFLPWPPMDRLLPCDDSRAVEFWPVLGGGMRQTLRVCYAMPAADVRALVEGDA